MIWLNNEALSDDAVLLQYRRDLLASTPNYLVIDDLFLPDALEQVADILQRDEHWLTQRHTYSVLYVDDAQWLNANSAQRFVRRDSWQKEGRDCVASDFLCYLRSDAFMQVLSRIFSVGLTDVNVEDPSVNTNYFRLGSDDMVRQHADDSPGRQVCMLLYLNQAWQQNSGGELVFKADGSKPVKIAPLFNRCVLFDPSSQGSEHWVEPLTSGTKAYRYNVTSWYWSE